MGWEALQNTKNINVILYKLFVNDILVYIKKIYNISKPIKSLSKFAECKITIPKASVPMHKQQLENIDKIALMITGKTVIIEIKCDKNMANVMEKILKFI